MTIDEFFVELERLKDNGWYLRDFNQNGIRCKDGRCPITAVTYALTSKVYGNAHYVDAAKQIGLSERDSDTIAYAADYNFKQLDDITANAKKVRIRLFETLGL